jgi:hypothetical protein
MKKRFTYLTVLLTLSAIMALAQDPTIPQPSPKQTITEEFGLGKITLTYCRPGVKGRKIFGLTEPYGLVWRTGANNATTIQFTDEVTIEGEKVLAGEYGLFSIPGEREWTFILNKTPKQWGAYSYKESEDLVRFKVPVAKAPAFNETLTLNFTEATNSACTLQLDWENTEVKLHLSTDADSQVMANIDKLMQGQKKPYYFASIYYYNHDKDIKKALEWISLRDKEQPNSFNVKYWKARIQLRSGDKAGAIVTAGDGLKLARDENSPEYIRLNQEVITQANEKQ